MKCMRCQNELLDIDARCPICDFSLEAWISAARGSLESKNKKIQELTGQVKNWKASSDVLKKDNERLVTALEDMMAWHEEPKDKGSYGEAIWRIAKDLVEKDRGK